VDADLFSWLEGVVSPWGIELRSLMLAWARVAPSVAIVPAFGLRGLPAPVRIGLAVCLALLIVPTVSQQLEGSGAGGLALAMLWQSVIGLPIAVTAAVALWAATMAGGLIDNLRGGQERANLPVVEPGSTPMGAALSVLVGVFFLESGGVARIAEALMLAQAPDLPVAAAVAQQLVGGIELAFAVAAPLLATALVLEIAGALVSRAASPAFIQPLVTSMKSLVLLGAAALLLDRMAAFLAQRVY
jgi:flagellar biosynthesis protein FliR